MPGELEETSSDTGAGDVEQLTLGPFRRLAVVGQVGGKPGAPQPRQSRGVARPAASPPGETCRVSSSHAITTGSLGVPVCVWYAHGSGQRVPA